MFCTKNVVEIKIQFIKIDAVIIQITMSLNVQNADFLYISKKVLCPNENCGIIDMDVNKNSRTDKEFCNCLK